MPKIETGFSGERFIVISQSFLELMEDNPLTGDLHIHSFGHLAHARFHHCDRHEGINKCVFLYCIWGRGTVDVDGKTFTLSTNQYVVLPPNVPHTYHSDDDDPWTLYWVIFGGVKSGIFARDMRQPKTFTPSVNSRQELRTGLFESMYAVLCGGTSLEKLNYANILLFHFLGSFLYNNLPEQESVTIRHAEGMVARVTHYMSENVEKKLTLKQISTFAGYSESYFYRKFVKETGMSPIEYFTHLKINKASIYLIKTSMNISQIAAKLGFNSPDYFSRTFKNIVGITATEFRKQDFRL